MSTSAVFDFAGPDSERLRDALSRAAAVLATDGRLAGPASMQDSLDELVPSPECSGVVSALEDGTILLAFVAPDAVGALGSSEVVTTTLTTVLGVAAAEIGLPVGEISFFERADDLITHLTEVLGVNGLERATVGAGIFDGDNVYATVGAILTASGPATDRGTSAGSAPETPVPAGVPAAGAAVLERGLQLLADIELTVTAELGRARLAVGELLDLQPGAIIELDREAGVPIDVLVNGTLFARGEVVVVDESFAVRVSEIVTDEGTR